MEDAAPVTRCLLFIRFLPEMMFRSLFQPEVLLCFQAIFSLFYLLVIPGQFAFAAGDLYCLLPGEWEETEAGSGYGNTTGPLCVVDGENTLTFSSTFFVSYIVDAAFFVTCLILLWRAMPSKLKSILCLTFLWRDSESSHWTFVRDRLLNGAGDGTDICSVTSLRHVSWPLIQTLYVFPFDFILWMFIWSGDITNVWPTQWVLVFRVRILPLAFKKADAMLGQMERNQNVAFWLARFIRILFIWILVTHLVTCTFIFAANQPTLSQHYLTAPWMKADPNALIRARDTGGFDSQTYMRTVYWALMTMTTVGHVDTIDDDPSRAFGMTWEIIIAIIIMLVVSLVYIWVTANFTSMMLRVYQNLEKYRQRVTQVDSYLRRHRVRASLCRLVRQHIKQAYENAGRDDDALLRELPRSLRRELMIDINMRTLRRAPFFLGCDPGDDLARLLEPNARDLPTRGADPQARRCRQGVTHPRERYDYVHDRTAGTGGRRAR